MKPVYISATCQDSGKTSVICGLIQLLRHQGRNPGYIKPVGQRYIQYKGSNVDEDAVLMHKAFGFKDNPSDMSPIAIAKGFTAKFINNPDVSPLENRILKSCEKIAANHGIVIIEGTGHAGVGSCFGLSNARVAQMLEANVIIVATGGIGRPIDELTLSLSLFKQYNVNVIGVILNKVYARKWEKIVSIASLGLGIIRTSMLGALPYDMALSDFSVGRVAEEFGYEILCGREAMKNRVEHTVVAAMEPQHVLDYIEKNTLIITPGDRIDNILLTLTLSESKDFHEKLSSCGLILTGGLRPHSTILSLLLKSSIPVLITDEDTFKVTAKMKDLHFKIRSDDSQKIAKTYELIRNNIDIESLLNSLQ